MIKPGVILILSLFAFICYPQTSHLCPDYLNQEAPGDSPMLFAPGIISRSGYFEYPCSFSPDYSEMYFGVYMFNERVNERYILQVKRENNGTWSPSEKISFTGFPESEPLLSPDGSKLFFSVHSESSKSKPHDIWYVKREKNGWSEPIRAGVEINSGRYEYYASITKNERLYFTREGRGIFTAEFIDGKFSNVHAIGSPVGDFKFAGHPFVAPDESYIIFDSRERGGYGTADLYISYREDGRWGTPVNLGEKINTRNIEIMPIVTPDGKYLFFCRKTGNERDIYWVKFDREKYRK